MKEVKKMEKLRGCKNGKTLVGNPEDMCICPFEKEVFGDMIKNKVTSLNESIENLEGIPETTFPEKFSKEKQLEGLKKLREDYRKLREKVKNTPACEK